MAKEFKKGKMVPVPSHSIVPERDVNKLPVLECQHLGIDIGGLTAVNEFNLTIGRTEIAGLIGPNPAMARCPLLQGGFPDRAAACQNQCWYLR